MDYNSMASTFAQVVGLICNYIGMRNEKKINLDDFMTWIKEHHKEIANYIAENNVVVEEIKTILDADHEVLKQRFNSIDEILATISSSMDFTAGLAYAIRPKAVLSEQAIHILETFVDSGGEKLIEIKKNGAFSSLCVSGYSAEFKITNGRFLYDDLNTLEKIGSISRMEDTHQGNRKYYLKRAGEKFIREYRRNK